MKWENRDINVVDWTNIPKFSKLDDILTPVRLLELFSDDTLVNMIVGYTKLYTQREKADIRFEITNQKIRLFLGMLLLREAGGGGGGVVGGDYSPDSKFNWETTPDTFVGARSALVLSNALERILWNLYICDNKQLHK